MRKSDIKSDFFFFVCHVLWTFVDNKRHKKREIPRFCGISTFVIKITLFAFCVQDYFYIPEEIGKIDAEWTNEAEAVYRYCESARLFIAKRI